MKNFRRGLGGVFCLFTAAALTACSGGQTPATQATGSTPTVEKFTVSFDSQGGSAVESQQVEKGALATKPADPTRTDYEFVGWYKEAACENDFDFTTEKIVANTTLYASWLDTTATDGTRATFYWNYEGAQAEVYKTVPFADGGRITKPADPKRTGYEFDGWYTSTDYTTEYKLTNKYTGNQSFYAKWLKVFTMEAENTQLTGLTWSNALDNVVSQTGDKKGSNFSGNVSGKGLIREDAGSSNGKFVWGCLNLEEGYLDFEFTADKADDHAKLYLVLSVEFWGFEITPESFKVLVNPTDNDDDSVDYATIDFTSFQETTDSNLHPSWTTAYINEVSVKQGSNLIRLLVNNDNSRGIGTIQAQGPIVDCIKIKSTSELVMTTYNN